MAATRDGAARELVEARWTQRFALIALDTARENRDGLDARALRDVVEHLRGRAAAAASMVRAAEQQAARLGVTESDVAMQQSLCDEASS